MLLFNAPAEIPPLPAIDAAGFVIAKECASPGGLVSSYYVKTDIHVPVHDSHPTSKTIQVVLFKQQ